MGISPEIAVALLWLRERVLIADGWDWGLTLQAVATAVAAAAAFAAWRSALLNGKQINLEQERRRDETLTRLTAILDELYTAQEAPPTSDPSRGLPSVGHNRLRERLAELLIPTDSLRRVRDLVRTDKGHRIPNEELQSAIDQVSIEIQRAQERLS